MREINPLSYFPQLTEPAEEGSNEEGGESAPRVKELIMSRSSEQSPS